MLRTLVLAAFVLAATVPLAGSAQTVPSSLNLHNGYIQVNNHTVVVMPPPSQRDHLNNLPNRVIRLRNPFSLQQELDGDRWGPLYLNKCCIAAGTRYEVIMAETKIGPITVVVVHPRLCNLRGIPFGFAEVTYAGNFTWNDKERVWASAVTARVDDAACPTG